MYVHLQVQSISVIETTDDDVILSRTPEIITALGEDKAKKELDVLFLAVVNIVELKSNLLLLPVGYSG